MIPRGAPYISWADLGAAVFHSVIPSDPASTRRRVETLWAANTVASLSVRSGLDALLQVAAFPAESEIIMSAITIPHVLDILAHHGLTAVPVDVDTRTLAVDPRSVRVAITGRTKAILVAHLFGSRMSLDDIVGIAREHGLLFVEDCAQANDGSGFRGHPESDVSLFSFGPIKRQTALGGALLRFRDSALAERVRAMQDAYPRQSRRAYRKRIATMAMIKTVVLRPVFDLFAAVCRWRRLDHDRVLGTALRAFGGGDLFVRLRQQPSAPLLCVLERRLRQSATKAVSRRMAIVAAVTAAFPELPRPGAGAVGHTHWLFPMLTPEPERVMRRLWARGFDATRGASNLTCVPAPPGRTEPVQAARLMQEVLYLPLFPSATPAELRRLADAIRDIEPSTQPRPLLATTIR